MPTSRNCARGNPPDVPRSDRIDHVSGRGLGCGLGLGLQDVDPRELRAFANEFGATIRSLPFQLPENFLLVIRAVSLTSGLSSTLDPEFNIWNAVEPYAERLLRDEGGGVVATLARDAVSSIGAAARLPRRLDDLATRLENGEIHPDPLVVFADRHDVHLTPDGAFAKLLGCETIRVNSLHGQGILEPGERVVIEGVAEDGTIEAIRIADAPSFALGVQWHAEYDPQQNPINRALFEAFGEALKVHQRAG